MKKQTKAQKAEELKNYAIAREVVKTANKQLANDNLSQETKKEIATLLHTTLHALGQYSGFNYTAWLNGGFEAWKQSGEPLDNRPFLGKEYDRFYY